MLKYPVYIDMEVNKSDSKKKRWGKKTQNNSKFDELIMKTDVEEDY